MSQHLSPDQRFSAVWLIVKAHADERLQELRIRLESQIGFEETLAVRAQIREVKKLLDLENPEQEIVPNAE